MSSIYDFIVKDRQGREVSLSEYRGKVPRRRGRDS